MSHISCSCLCGCPGQFLSVDASPSLPLPTLRQRWKEEVTSSTYKFHCSTCGCVFVAEDDGVPSSEGGSIQASTRSAPRVDSIGVQDSGPTSGGTVIHLTGHAFGVATTLVTVGGVSATNVVVITDSLLSCETPPGAEGPADISVSNFHGQRLTGHTLVSGFTYEA